MSSGTVAAPPLATVRERPTAPERTRPGLSGWQIAAMMAACLVAAALTLLLPSTPTYDPWSWLIWGREILHLDLVTTNGPSWKPLPILFTVPFSLFGDAAPDLWLVVARAGAILGLLMAFRLAWRLSGGGIAGAAAGLIAAAGVWTALEFVRTAALGNSEGLLVGLGLLAIDRHLDGRPRQALVYAWLVALLRPETWPFLALYGLWIWFRRPELRRFGVILAVALAALWFLPELWGSGKLFRSVDRAHQGNAGTPINAAVPWRAVLDQERYVLASAVKWAALAAGVIGAAVGLLKLRRRRRGERGEVTGGDNRALETLALALGALAFVAVVAAGTQWGGFSGNTRYLLLATATIAVIGGVGFGWVARGAGALVERRFGHRAGLAVTALAAVVALGFTWHFGVGHRLHEQNKVWNALDQAGRVRSDLEKTLPRLGGRDKALACGDVVTGRFQVPLLAWHLDVGFDRVSYVPVRATGVSFQTPGQGTQSRVALPSGFHRVLDLGAWRVAARCPAL